MTQAQDDLVREVAETKAIAAQTLTASQAAVTGIAQAAEAIGGLKAALDAAIANGTQDAFLAGLAAELDTAQGTIANANTAVADASAALANAVAAAAPAPAPTPAP